MCYYEDISDSSKQQQQQQKEIYSVSLHEAKLRHLDPNKPLHTRASLTHLSNQYRAAAC